MEDPENTGYPVDVVEARHHHPRVAPGVLLAHAFRTGSEWESSQMPRLRMKLRLIGTENRSVRWINVGFEGRDSSFRGTIDDGRRFLGFAYTWRPDRSSGRVEFPRSVVGGADAYRWSARIYQGCDDSGESSCVPEWDRVPDSGTVRHEL